VVSCHHVVDASFVHFFDHIGHSLDQEDDNSNAKSVSIQGPMDKIVCSGGNAPGFYSVGARFESRPDHGLS
jgi:hypothetical protein